MTRASEEGLSLIKEEVVEYFPLFCCLFGWLVVVVFCFVF